MVVDLEIDTSHGEFGNPIHKDNHVLLASWRVGPEHLFALAGGHPGTQSHWGSELDHYWLAEAIKEAEFVVAHNAKYELGWFMRMGIDIHKVLVWDTQLAEYVLLGNLAAGSPKLGMPRRSVSLDMCCRRRGLPIKDPVVDLMMDSEINPTEMPRPWLQGRCEQDVTTTEQLFILQRAEIQARGLLSAVFTRCLLTPVLADIESEGMGLDGQAVSAEYAKYSAEHVQLSAEMSEFSGGINPDSPQQMARLIYGAVEDGGLGFKELTNKRGEPKRNKPTKQWPNGVPLTDNDTLDKLSGKTKRQERFLALREKLGKVQAMLSKNLEFFKGVVEQYDSIFYGQLNQTSTATHRLASTGLPLKIRDPFGEDRERRVQFQNFPRIFKKLFRAKRTGWLMADPDGSQLEFRVAAFLGDDEQAIKDIEDPTFDAHIITASVLNDMTEDEVRAEKKEAQAAGRDDLRQLAKPETYKPLYGGKKGNPAQEKYYAEFRKRYSGISRTQDGWVEQALEHKYTRTAWGLVYYWPTARRGFGGHVNVESAVDNYPIQALATAEIIPIAAVYLWHRINAEGLNDRIRLVNLVHDNTPAEVHPSATGDFERLAKQSYTSDVYGYLEKVYGLKMERVPLGIGLKIGEHWGEGKEQAWDIYMDGRSVKRK